MMKCAAKSLVILLMIFGLRVQAQLPVDGVHYPAGLNGIKCGSLPSSGVYLRDDNLFYTGTADLPQNYDTFIYLQAPSLMWMTDLKIFGGNFGMNTMLPIIYKQVSYGKNPPPGGGYSLKYKDSQFGVGDIEIEPLQLSWHLKHFDFMAGYALWAPTGEYDKSSNVNLGDGLWTHMITLGGTWYPDKEHTWAVSVLNQFEFNSQQSGPRTSGSPGGGYPSIIEVPCSVFTLEWGISKTVFKETDVGIIGYYQRQFTDQTDATVIFSDSSAAGIGPELRSRISRWGLSASLRYAYEFLADNRPQGQTINLTLAKQF